MVVYTFYHYLLTLLLYSLLLRLPPLSFQQTVNTPTRRALRKSVCAANTLSERANRRKTKSLAVANGREDVKIKEETMRSEPNR